MKKVFLILISSLFFIYLHAETNDKNFTYKNKNIGIAVVFPEEWKIYTSASNCPVFFKENFKDKKTENDSPLFLGANKNQTGFVRCLKEEYTGDIDAYYELLKAMMSQESINIIYSNLSKETNTYSIIYEANVKSLKLTFLEYLSKVNSNVIRISFWSLSSMFNKNIDAFLSIFDNVYFNGNTKNKKTNWNNKWNLIDKNQFKKLDNNKTADSSNDAVKDIADNENKYLFYKIKGKSNTIYILGSIHLGSADFYPLSDKVENAFSESNNLVLEVDLSKTDMAKDLVKSAELEEGKTLDQVINKSLYDKVDKEFNKYNFSLAKLNKYKPWMIATTLSVLKLMSLGYSDEYGVDKYFFNKAKDKKIYELESYDIQKDVLNKLNGEIFLAYTLLSLNDTDKNINTLIEAWKSGDEKKLENLLFTKSVQDQIINVDDFLYKDLFYDRNIKMLDKIEDYLTKNDDFFVIVGSGHLVGEKGIINLLTQKGYTIEK